MKFNVKEKSGIISECEYMSFEL
ncbi:hypothetical protein F383_38757 [Gossypium arboreum]|uniref:Uncharacterized protein n=1 Tax=Gossypium arboreum TaxID=29729 RepID=A0A0B0ME40_GOSAR|nr:hypothetical protein F383_38172 [Gossypium arboreum]KHF99861.1 hypothetical protein F383_38757 [Gossypium arboreum]